MGGGSLFKDKAGLAVGCPYQMTVTKEIEIPGGWDTDRNTKPITIHWLAGWLMVLRCFSSVMAQLNYSSSVCLWSLNAGRLPQLKSNQGPRYLIYFTDVSYTIISPESRSTPGEAGTHRLINFSKLN